MSAISLTLGIIFLILAAALLLLGALASLRRLPGNGAIGLRVAEVRKTREAWEGAHAVAGPFWLIGGVALAFGAFFSFIASGWLWVLPALTLVIAVVCLSVGANTGARMALLIDADVANNSASGCGENCNCGGNTSEHAASPAVDLSALRQAASAADER